MEHSLFAALKSSLNFKLLATGMICTDNRMCIFPSGNSWLSKDNLRHCAIASSAMKSEYICILTLCITCCVARSSFPEGRSCGAAAELFLAIHMHSQAQTTILPCSKHAISWAICGSCERRCRMAVLERSIRKKNAWAIQTRRGRASPCNSALPP